jgi:hypothetical protein
VLLASAAIYETWPASKTLISYRHDNALSARRYQPESIGPGVAIFDYDGDGWMDIYFSNSGPSDFYSPAKPVRNALYRNRRDGTFEDVTEKAGVPGRDFGIGVTAADYNNDGHPDLFVTNYGTNILYRNRGDGTFEDVTRQAGLAARGLWTAAVFFDADNNGTLDLFVGHFVRYDKSREPECKYGERYHYCHPLAYEPWPSRFYRNTGDGAFTDASEEAGISKHPGKTFGAVATDIDGDSFLDLFVANDSVPNFLFHNQRDGTFREIGLDAGVAYSMDGNPRSGMGVDAADYDNDGLQDLFVANFNREQFSIYRNLGKLQFADRAGETGIGTATQMYSGWGLRFFDFDHDGDDDLIVCNAHPDDRIEEISATLKWKEPLLLFENRAGRFVSVGARAGEAFSSGWPARGLATGDLDNDGALDIVIANNGDAPLILRHRGSPTNHWTGLDLGPSPAGARVRWSAGGVIRTRLVNAGGSYLSSHDPRHVLGLGTATSVDFVEIRWPAPSAKLTRLEKPEPGRYHTVRRN